MRRTSSTTLASDLMEGQVRKVIKLLEAQECDIEKVRLCVTSSGAAAAGSGADDYEFGLERVEGFSEPYDTALEDATTKIAADAAMVTPEAIYNMMVDRRMDEQHQVKARARYEAVTAADLHGAMLQPFRPKTHVIIGSGFQTMIMASSTRSFPSSSTSLKVSYYFAYSSQQDSADWRAINEATLQNFRRPDSAERWSLGSGSVYMEGLPCGRLNQELLG